MPTLAGLPTDVLFIIFKYLPSAHAVIRATMNINSSIYHDFVFFNSHSSVSSNSIMEAFWCDIIALHGIDMSDLKFYCSSSDTGKSSTLPCSNNKKNYSMQQSNLIPIPIREELLQYCKNYCKLEWKMLRRLRTRNNEKVMVFQPKEPHTITLKCIMLGDNDTGKTQFLNRYMVRICMCCVRWKL